MADIFQNCQNDFHNDKYQFLELLEQTIDLDEIVPVAFPLHFHARTGRPRRHQLYPMLWALLLQRIFSIPTDSLLILFLKYSQELRAFCGFDVVPDASMPPHAAANPTIRQMYINGHFCYAFKFGMITNGLGIIRDITFLIQKP